MAHSIIIPRSKLQPFLLNLGFVNLGNDEEVCFTRKHHLTQDLKVKIFTTIPLGGSETSKKRQAILVRGLDPKGDILFEAKILRTYSIENTLQRILRAARKAYKACNEYYQKNLKPLQTQVQSGGFSEPKPAPAPQMVSDYKLGQRSGFHQAIAILKTRIFSDRDYYLTLIANEPQEISYYLTRLLNDQILCLEDKARNLIPDVQ